MHISKLGGALAVGTLLAAPAAGLAAGHVVPANGKLKGTPHYKSFHNKPATGKLTVTVARHRIAAAELFSIHPPLDTHTSTSDMCGSVTDMTTKGHHAKGTVSASGAFHYTFTEAFKHGGKADQVDTITLAGRFTSATHATGTFRDVTNFTADGPFGKARCDTGTVHFSVAR